MCIKTTIVAYAFSLQYFENTTIIAYVGLWINSTMKINGMHMHIYISTIPFLNSSNKSVRDNS